MIQTVKTLTKIPLSKSYFSFKRVAHILRNDFFFISQTLLFLLPWQRRCIYCKRTISSALQYWRVYLVINVDIRHTGAFLMTSMSTKKNKPLHQYFSVISLTISW